MNETTKKKRVYLTDTKLWKELVKSDADIIILLSDRNVGKSYALKELALKDAINDHPFIYLRRNDLEVKTGLPTAWIEDYPVKKVDKSASGWTDYRGEIWTGIDDPKRKTLLPNKLVGFACDLFGESHYKSSAKFAERGVSNVIFEEFTTDGLYLKDEPAKLESFWSTVRRNNHVRVWCLGNGMSRVCPYFTQWGLRGVPRQTPGTIERYDHTVEMGEETLQMKIDVCIIPDLEGMGFGWFSKKKVKNTIWVTNSWPRLQHPKEEYQKIFTMYMIATDMYKFRLDVLYDHETRTPFWYVEPMTKDIKQNARIISSRYADIQNHPFGTVGFRVIHPAEKDLFQLLLKGHWVASDNLTGDDFNAALQNLMRL